MVESISRFIRSYFWCTSAGHICVLRFLPADYHALPESLPGCSYSQPVSYIFLGGRRTSLMGQRLDRAVVARYFAFLVISQLVIFTLIGVGFSTFLSLIHSPRSDLLGSCGRTSGE